MALSFQRGRSWRTVFSRSRSRSRESAGTSLGASRSSRSSGVFMVNSAILAISFAKRGAGTCQQRFHNLFRLARLFGNLGDRAAVEIFRAQDAFVMIRQGRQRQSDALAALAFLGFVSGVRHLAVERYR